MNIFEGLKKYGNSYEVKDTRSFSPEEIEQVHSCKVVSSEYGMSVCFFMKAGGTTYIPLSRDSVASIGDIVDIHSAKLLTLSREGSEDITRVEI